LNLAPLGSTLSRQRSSREVTMLLVLIHVLITIVIAAIIFWLIDKYVRDRRLSNLLKILVILICLAAILQRVLPLIGVNF
jgi:ABC-type bacteriocin/lantibiotic exporter with double-glycine peptidase domain